MGREYTLTTPPQLGKQLGGGGGKGEWRGIQGYPLFAGMGVRKSTHTKKREVKRKESERKMEEVVVVGDLEKDLGTPHPTVLAPARRAVAERPALSSGPAPSFLWAAGGDSGRPPPFPFRAGGKGVCVSVLGGGPGVHPEACTLPRTP